MLPDPLVKGDWRGKDVKWYPARFLKHHPQARNPKREFEFRYLDCIDWSPREDNFLAPTRHCTHDRETCQEMLNFKLPRTQIGNIRIPAFYVESDLPEDHPLIEIYAAAVAPLVKLLVSFPDDHPVVHLYKSFYTELATEEEEDDSAIKTWTSKFCALKLTAKDLSTPVRRTLTQLVESRAVSVPYAEWRRRARTVGRVLLWLLAIQYELEEPLNLNGDTWEDIQQQAIISTNLDYHRALAAILVVARPKELRHKKYWDPEAFRAFITDFRSKHAVHVPSYRPLRWTRIYAGEKVRPPIPISALGSTEEAPTKRRSRPDTDDEEDTPAPKRQAASRILRARVPKGPQQEKVVAVPVDRIVASGKGWVEVEWDES
ncbi:hypothetical protein B0H16DRAFT_1721059 [Mycena metata]|uniref:Uncharacterized protein n=1 Tax=Mycena metata TaxID=1033252 RepID=A0AAD7NFE3_9AGAR|nr:hypothetical protein B0H16DRAFT_1721059 [Mycena metata]